MIRSPVKGVKYIKCEECDCEWFEYSRDILSPSGVTCQSCHSLETITLFVMDKDVIETIQNLFNEGINREKKRNG